jgi:hypothetical protein
MGMALKMSRKIQGASPRFFSKAALVVTILPLWALWVYAYATFETLRNEAEGLPRFYGMYLYKEHVRSRLEGVVRMMALLEEQRGEEVEGGPLEGLTRKEWESFDLIIGPEEALVVVKRAGLRVLYPSEPPYGSAEFLGEPEGREAFLRTLHRMDANGFGGGYLTVDTSDAPDGSGKRSWFLAVAPVGEHLIGVLPVPEEQIRLSGGILEEAQESLLNERRKRFVRLTLPVVVLSSLFIWILYRQSMRTNRGRGT